MKRSGLMRDIPLKQLCSRILLVVGLLLITPPSVAFPQTDAPGEAGKAPAGSDLETVRNRFIDELLEPEVNRGEIQELLDTAQKDGTWPHINYEDTSRTAFEHSQHLSNMVELARAYKKKESEFYRDPDLKQTIYAAFDFWLEHDFICENWWWNQIGTPERIGNLLLIMDEALTEEQKVRADPIVGRANLDAWGARPGGDLIKIAGIMGKHGLFKRDGAILNEALGAIAGEIGYAVDRGDPSDERGLQVDFSFHHRHDRVTSTITYGRGFASYFVDWAEKVNGTAFAFPDEAVELIVDFYLDGITKAMAFGRYPDPGALNRGITRRGAFSPQGPELPEKLLRVTSYRQDELEALAQIRRGEREPDLTSSQFFWHTEYYSHQRPHYFASVRMFSSRNHSMEVPYNGEGLKNHHLADGYNFISRTGREYVGVFPIWDWQKIPGTTVVQKPALPDPEEIQQPGRTVFVGGVANGRYGAAAFDFESPLDPLSARKSWFFFDDEFVALGAAIRSDSDYPVATTLNQSLLNGDVVVESAEGTSVFDRGTHEVAEVAWVHHDGTAYLFPEPTAVRLENRQRSGAWKEINGQTWAEAAGEVRKEVFALWLDHGVAPRQAGYEYIVVPGMGPSEVDRYRDHTPIEVLANTSEVQAVKHRALGLSQIVFYKPGETVIADGVTVSAETPGLVMVKTAGRGVEEITVSDPSRQLDSITVQITSRLEAEEDRWEATWNREGGYSTVRFDLPEGEYAGQSVSAEFP